MGPSDRIDTIRIMNDGPLKHQVSLNLAHYVTKASGKLRRGVYVATSVLIPHNGYYDICAELGVTLEEAREVVKESVELRRFLARGQLRLIEPPASPLPEVQASTASTSAPSSTQLSSVEAVSPELDSAIALFAARLAPEAPASMVTPAPIPDSPAEVPEVSETVAAPTPAAEPRMLSSDWTHAELVAYAEEHGIDASGSKSVLLKRLRKEAR